MENRIRRTCIRGFQGLPTFPQWTGTTLYYRCHLQQGWGCPSWPKSQTRNIEWVGGLLAFRLNSRSSRGKQVRRSLPKRGTHCEYSSRKCKQGASSIVLRRTEKGVIIWSISRSQMCMYIWETHLREFLDKSLWILELNVRLELEGWHGESYGGGKKVRGWELEWSNDGKGWDWDGERMENI